MHSGSEAYVGQYYGNGTLTLNGSSKLTTTGLFDATHMVTDGLIIGDEAATGLVTVNDSAQITSTGDILLGQEWGNTPAAIGVATLTVAGSGAVVSTTGSVIVGANGAIGTYNQNAGTTTSTLKAILGQYDYWDAGSVPNQTPGNGTLNLNGGVFAAPLVTTDTDPAGAAGIQGTAGTVNFNGGVLRALAASANFITTDLNPAHAASTMTLNVLAGGAKIDTNSFNDTILLPMLHGGGGTDGGLVKLGAGTLTLSGALSYNGNTTVDAGTLTLTVPLNTPNARVYVATGTTLNATSIVADTLTIGGPPMAAPATTPVPEPGTLVLLALAGMGLLLAVWRRT